MRNSEIVVEEEEEWMMVACLLRGNPFLLMPFVFIRDFTSLGISLLQGISNSHFNFFSFFLTTDLIWVELHFSKLNQLYQLCKIFESNNWFHSHYTK